MCYNTYYNGTAHRALAVPDRTPNNYTWTGFAVISHRMPAASDRTPNNFIWAGFADFAVISHRALAVPDRTPDNFIWTGFAVISHTGCLQPHARTVKFVSIKWSLCYFFLGLTAGFFETGFTFLTAFGFDAVF